MKYRLVAILSIIFIATSLLFTCCLEKRAVDNLYVTVHNSEQVERISIWKSNNEGYYFFLPAYADLESSQLHVETGSNIVLNGQELGGIILCSEFEFGISYPLVYYLHGVKRETTLTFLRSRNLPAFYIDTESYSMDSIHSSRENKEKALARVYLSDGTLNYSGKVESIGGRGNSSWNEYEKKPYNINLEQSANMLEMGSAEKWVLLANASDTSHVKNKLVYDFARQFEMWYTPEARWVDLYLNGNYVGLYLLCEKIQIHPERVNIGHKNTALVSQEVESRLVDNGDPYIKTQAELAIRIRESSIPEETLLQVWQSAENAILSEDGIDCTSGKTWTELIDLTSWAKKYLIEEFFGNADGGYCSQYFFVQDVSDVIYAGPVWDYDFSMYYDTAFYANRFYVKPEEITPWYPSLWNKPLFQSRVKNFYSEELKPIVYRMQETIDSYCQLIADSAHMDEIRWGKSLDSFREGITHVKTYLLSRTDFLDSVWIEGEQYCYIQIDTRAGNNIEIHTLRPGEPLAPILDEIILDDENLLQWYDAETNQKIDPTAPIEKDMSIYAIWSTKGTEKYFSVLFPILLITLIFFMLLTNDIGFLNIIQRSSKILQKNISDR